MAVQQPSRVAQLLAAGHHVDQSDKYGGTPLLYAAAMNIPDTAMMLVENGANLLSTLSDCYPIICIVAGRQNWTLVWRIIDFAAASHPYLVPQLIKGLLAWTPEEGYHAAHHSKDQDGCDGKTLMHMTRGVRSARALIKLGFTKFKQRKGDLLEHIASLHDPPLFRFAVANGGDAHLHSSWGWHILDMLLRDLARSNWDDLPKVLEILQGLLDNGVQVSSRDEWVCNCLTGGCVPGSKWLLIRPNLRLFAWLGILERQRNMQEARNVSLALLRRMSFDQADLHHTYDTISHSDLVSDVDNDRFWDISEQISIDELKREMEDLAAKAYSELKIEVMTSKHPKIPEPFSSSWDRIVQKKMESNRWSLNYDLELAVVEFGVDLYRCGGNQFESWLPLLTQLTDILLAEEPEALES
ncbi:Ankyrin repeat-containing domain superfamily [Fusarium oxysporum f. sp. vasinfectum]|nr:Ankyrin repeat-containing domain superfamily [Fusarium oxysporum f. sp. vasinfectum]